MPEYTANQYNNSNNSNQYNNNNQQTNQQKGKKDLEIWREYKQAKKSGNHRKAQKKARELYQQMKGIIYNYTNRYVNQGKIPGVAIRSKGREAFKQAIDRYDPSQGAKLSTFVTNYMQQVKNFNKKYRESARIPQNRATQIDNYIKTKSDLEVKKGREPNMQEMSEAMNWNIGEVRKMENELKRKELSSDQLMESGLSLDPTGEMDDKMETLHMVYMMLDGREKVVFEHLTDFGPRVKLDSAKAIAEELGTSESTVSRIRKNLKEKIKKHL